MGILRKAVTDRLKGDRPSPGPRDRCGGGGGRRGCGHHLQGSARIAMASKRFRDAIGIDPERIVSSALQAALGETQPHGQKHHPGRVLAAGAALAAAAAVGQKRMPRMAKVPLRMGLHKLADMARVDEFTDALRDRLTGYDDEPA